MCGYRVVLCAMGKKEAFVWSSRGWTMSQPYASRDARGDGEGDGDGRRGIVMDADEDVRDLVRGLVGASASSTRRLARGTNGRCLNRGDDGTRDDGVETRETRSVEVEVDARRAYLDVPPLDRVGLDAEEAALDAELDELSRALDAAPTTPRTLEDALDALRRRTRAANAFDSNREAMDDAPTAPKMWHARFLDDVARDVESSSGGFADAFGKASSSSTRTRARSDDARLDAAAIPVVSAREAMGTLLTSLREVSARLDVASAHVEEAKRALGVKMGSK